MYENNQNRNPNERTRDESTYHQADGSGTESDVVPFVPEIWKLFDLEKNN